MFFMLQNMFWMFLAGAFALLIHDYLDAKEDEDENRQMFDKWPFALALIAVFTRTVVIAIRAGAASVTDWADLSERIVPTKELESRLLRWAWVTMPPEQALAEVELSMVKCGAQDHFFKFLTLTKVFPTMKKKITDPSYWEKFGWTFPS